VPHFAAFTYFSMYFVCFLDSHLSSRLVVFSICYASYMACAKFQSMMSVSVFYNCVAYDVWTYLSWVA